MKNSTNTNLLILDEIFDSSLDGTGTDEFLKILNTLGDENVFVISHKQDQLVDKFRKENGDVWGRRTNLTEQSRKNIIRYRSCGWGIKRLAKKFSVSNQTVRKVLSEQKQEHEHVLDLVKNFRHIVE